MLVFSSPEAKNSSASPPPLRRPPRAPETGAPPPGDQPPDPPDGAARGCAPRADRAMTKVKPHVNPPTPHVAPVLPAGAPCQKGRRRRPFGSRHPAGVGLPIIVVTQAGVPLSA